MFALFTGSRAGEFHLFGRPGVGLGTPVRGKIREKEEEGILPAPGCPVWAAISSQPKGGGMR